MATIVIAGFILVETTKTFVYDNARQAFITQTRIAAASINSSLVKSLTGTASDTASSQHKLLKSHLIAIKNTSEDMRFVYLMRLKNNNVIFLVDAEPADSAD
ncbi:MAG: hypothetical protein HKM94_09600, partial [Halobacteria archaeon]|nr:hypothetical protein [Halobacteria archaeon]